MTNPSFPIRLSRLVTGLARRLSVGPVPKLFDAGYYLETYPDAAGSGLDPFLHYVRRGVAAGHNPNEMFDTAFYVAQSSVMQGSVAQSARRRLDPVRHYLRTGAAEGLDPHPLFSTRLYLVRYPDVAAGRTNPLRHYREHGRREGRLAERSGLVPLDPLPLVGLSAAHRRTLPGRDGRGFAIGLLRGVPATPARTMVDRICLCLALDDGAILGLVRSFERFPGGVQDRVHLVFPDTRAPMPSRVIVAFAHCFLQEEATPGMEVLGYAEAVIWDLRTPTATVIGTYPAGTVRIETGASRPV